MGAKVVIPCMIPFSGDQLRTPTGRHRWRDEVYATFSAPGTVVERIDVTVMDQRCIHCRNWRGDVIAALTQPQRDHILGRLPVTGRKAG
jgi:hypothetical protein